MAEALHSTCTMKRLQVVDNKSDKVNKALRDDWCCSLFHCIQKRTKGTHISSDGGEFRLLLFGCWKIKVANLFNGNLAISNLRAYVLNTSEHFSHHSKQHVFNRNDVRYVPVNIQAPTPISPFTRSQISRGRVTVVCSGFPENSSLSATLPFNRTNRSDTDKQIVPTRFWTFSLELPSCCRVSRLLRLLLQPLHLLRSQRQKQETRAHCKCSLFCVVALQSRAEDYLYGDPGIRLLSGAPISCFTGRQHTDLLCHASSSVWFMLSHSAGSAFISDEE